MDDIFNNNFSKKSSRKFWLLWSGGVILFFLIFYGFFIKAPTAFPVGRLLTVENGSTFDQTAIFLQKNNIIQSPLFFRFFVFLFGGDKKVMAGDYIFSGRVSVIDVARKVTHGDFGLTSQKIVIPEGTSVSEISIIIKNQISDFDAKTFVKLALEKEGYLFPDTYFFMNNIKPAAVISAMNNNFNEKIKTIQKQIDGFKKPLKDIITMASLVEEEARTAETRKIIAGILWKRLSIEMPLQVDAVFPYILGKNTYEVDADDLQIDSPYNTYKYKGLPKGPITNPGLEAILDTITPTKTAYLYYLSDKKGVMHYASSFGEHVANKQKFLQ